MRGFYPPPSIPQLFDGMFLWLYSSPCTNGRGGKMGLYYNKLFLLKNYRWEERKIGSFLRLFVESMSFRHPFHIMNMLLITDVI